MNEAADMICGATWADALIVLINFAQPHPWRF